MNKIFYLSAILGLFISCNSNTKVSKIQNLVESYHEFKLTSPILKNLSQEEETVLQLYKDAAKQADNIFWKQNFGDKNIMLNEQNQWVKEFAMINYGPWNRLTGDSFIKGYSTRPLGANFYPKDMTNSQFDNWNNINKLSPYTIIKRDSKGLNAVWFHDEYKDEIKKISDYLNAAAQLCDSKEENKYLNSLVTAINTDNYYQSNIDWLDMKNAKLELILGPIENSDDQLYGLKNSYSSIVLIKDSIKTSQINKFTEKLNELQQLIPCKDEIKNFTCGSCSQICAYDALYYAGGVNAGIKQIALNLPYNTKIQRDKGTRTIIIQNVIEEKFNRIVHPTGQVLIEKDQQLHLDCQAFYWNIVFREVSHALGVKQTTSGININEALGNQFLTWEDIKANILGLYLVCKMIDKHEIPALITKEDAITTYFANLLRSDRFGVEVPLGRANVIIYNFLKENQAFKRNPSGQYTIDYSKFYSNIEKLSELVLNIQANGNYLYAKRFAERYSKNAIEFSYDDRNLRLEHIPIDLRFIE